MERRLTWGGDRAADVAQRAHEISVVIESQVEHSIKLENDLVSFPDELQDKMRLVFQDLAKNLIEQISTAAKLEVERQIKQRFANRDANQRRAAGGYPMMGSDDWRGDETLDRKWHIPSEFIHGTFADYAIVPRRNAIPLPSALSPLHASVLGTAWLTAYRALFTKSGLRAGETVLIQGATGGVATALIQLGRAAGFEIWATSRTEKGRALAMSLGAHQAFPSNSSLPRKVSAVIDNIGAQTWEHSLSALDRGGTLVTTGGTTGFEAPLNLLPVISNQLTITGSIMGTLEDMRSMLNLIARTEIEPVIGTVLPMERAQEAFHAMWEGRTSGKTVFTR